MLYASFNGHTVGVLQGKASPTRLKGRKPANPVVAELNGGQEDANAFLFKGGYDSILKPLYKSGTLKAGPDQFVPGWDNQKAGTIFEQMLIKTGNKIDGVAAANDGIANAVVVALKAHQLKPIPLSGQDATTQGVQNIISGWQTMTVFKDVRKLAAAAAKAAVAIVKGKAAPDDGRGQDEGPRDRAGVPDPAAVDHEGELQAPLHVRLPEEGRRLQRRRTRSTASRQHDDDAAEAAHPGASAVRPVV